MTTRPTFFFAVMLAVVTATSAATQAQYSDPGYNPYHPAGYGTQPLYNPDGGYLNSQDDFRPIRDDFRNDGFRYDNNRDYDYGSGRYETGNYGINNGDAIGNGQHLRNEPFTDSLHDPRQRPGRRGTRGQGQNGAVGWNSRPEVSERDSLADPFRLPSGAPDYGDPRYELISRDNSLFDSQYRDLSLDNPEQRYRVPLNPEDDGRPLPNDRGWSGSSYPGNKEFSRPEAPVRGLDPFTPAPLPHRDTTDEVTDINTMITARYQNPTTIRTVRSMTPDQAIRLYREVSQQTDQRHLEPSSYDLRVRRAIRNLAMALDNPAFVDGLGISVDSFRTDAFRDSLSRIYSGMQVRSLSDAERVMQTVMQEAQSVPGLGANVVAFEFTNATIDTLDKFSALEPTDPNRGAALETESKTAGLESEIVGIGVEVKEHADGLLVMKALRGGPAAEIGLQAGDVITAIDRRSIGGMPMASSVDLMKGSAGSSITLRVVRSGYKPREATLVRRRVRVWTVNDTKILSGTDQVAYLSLSQFGQTSTQELDEALQQLHKQGMKSLILDLRGNPGGLLNVCVDISNRFLPCGTIVSTKGRLSSDNMVETATFERTWSNPLVVLIDGDSASASEIFAAAVQDNQRGIVLGDKSYGKGTVQTHFPLQTVSGNLRLTTARFYSPNGRPMSRAGVIPDVRIVDEDGPANGDRVLEEAVRIAQTRQLSDMAAGAAKCRINNTAVPLMRNSFNDTMSDSVRPKTVLR